MRAAKVMGLSMLFWFAGFVLLLVISAMRGTVRVESSHATALSAVVAGILEALLNPMTWLVIVVAFGIALWLTRKTSKHASTS